MKEQKKISLESLVSEIEKNGRIGRLGKVFKTEKNYYFYDTGTGKVAKLNSNVYIVLKSLLEGMPVEYYGAAEPPVRCGESHLSGLTEPPHFVY